jgi:succinate--hydroxymethylglutarate CoA-transferase
MFKLSLLSHIAANYLNAGWEAKRHGTAHASVVPYQAFTCQDGEQIVVAAANDQFFKELCSVGYFLHSKKIHFSFFGYLDY